MAFPLTHGKRKMFRLLLIAAASLALTGCAQFNFLAPNPVEPDPELAQTGLVLTGEGVQKFQCTSDKNGYWLRFIAPEVTLRDAAGRIVAYQGADHGFVAPDRSRLKAKIERSSPGRTENDLKDLLYAVTRTGKVQKGALTPYRWVKRDQATGGIPTVQCSRSELGALISVRFTARYTFYTEKPKK